MTLLKKLLHKRIGLVLLSLVFSITNVAVSLWWNSQVSIIINIINEGNNVPGNLIIKSLITVLAGMAAAYITALCSSWTAETLMHELRMGYARHLTALSLAEIEELNAGRQLSMLQNELGDISDFLRSNLFMIADDIIRFAVTLSWMLWLNPGLTLLANLPTVILVCYTTLTSRIISKTAIKSQEANGQMNAFADILITLFPIIKLFEANSLIKEKYNLALEKWEKANILEERKRATLMSLAAWMSCFPLLLLFMAGGMQVIKGQITIGSLYIFINLSGNVSGIMNNMPGRIALFRRFAANLKRIESFVS